MNANDIRVTAHVAEQFVNRVSKGLIEVDRAGLAELAASGFWGLDFGFIDEATGQRVARPRDGQRVVLTTVLYKKGTSAERISGRQFRSGGRQGYDNPAAYAECRAAYWSEYHAR